MGNVQDVEVGHIRNQSHAEEVAAEYIRNHPEFEWTGQWNTTRPGEMSTIEIREKEPGPTGLQQGLSSFLDGSLNSAMSSGVGQSARGAQGNSRRREAGTTNLEDLVKGTFNTIQQSLTEENKQSLQGLASFVDASLNMSSGLGQTARGGHGNTRRREGGPGNIDDLVEDTMHTLQQGFTSFLDDRRREAESPDSDDDYGRQSGSSSQGNSTRPNVSTIWITELVAMFPGTAESTICDLLENNDYNVDKTIEDLLQLVPDASNTTQRDTEDVSNSTQRDTGDASNTSQSNTGEASNTNQLHTRPNEDPNSSLPMTPSCPVCWEAIKPPKRIFQCVNGHLVCEVCHRQPQLRGCPTCREPIMGRATAMEHFLADLQKGL